MVNTVGDSPTTIAIGIGPPILSLIPWKKPVECFEFLRYSVEFGQQMIEKRLGLDY